MRKVFSAFLLGLPLVAASAHAATYAEPWGGATVSITYPDQVTYNTAFDVSFSVDSSTMTTPDAIAFFSELTISDTVILDSATWSYAFTSTDPNWNWNYSGAIGDTYASLTTVDAGYQISFTDLKTGAYTWLWRNYSDTVTWTIGNMIIQADTNFSLRLDDSNIVSGPTQLGFTVLDPPAVLSAVPEPSAYITMLLGVATLVAVRDRQQRSRPLFCCAPA